MSNNKKSVSKAKKSSIPTRDYVLTRDVLTSKGLIKAGSKVKLTKEGAKAYRIKNRIE